MLTVPSRKVIYSIPIMTLISSVQDASKVLHNVHNFSERALLFLPEKKCKLIPLPRTIYAWIRCKRVNYLLIQIRHYNA